MTDLSNFHTQIFKTPELPVDSPRLVFLHGLMGFSANWRRIARGFEKRFEILVYDQRGHGRSFQPATGYAPEDYAQDLKDILDQLGWNEIYLVGHSMGGRVAMHFAYRYPERVKKLVVEDIGPQVNQSGGSFVEKLLDTVPVPFASRAAAKEWFETEFLELFQEMRKKEALADYLYANITENDQKQAEWRFSLEGVKESIRQGRAKERWDEIEGLKMPTLLVRGEYSTDLPRAVYERMLQSNPQIQGVEFDGSGHWIHAEQPDRFIEVLDQFLSA